MPVWRTCWNLYRIFFSYNVSAGRAPAPGLPTLHHENWLIILGMTKSKYIVLLGDGMAGWPLEELEGRTCLQAAHTPHMDYLAGSATLFGSVRTIPDGFPAGSDVANLSIFGYDPRKYYTGRSPLEAGSMGVELADEDVAFRCNLVTLDASDDREDPVMEDYSGGHITTDEAGELIESLKKDLQSSEIRFFPGVSYRHLMVWKGGSDRMETTPPHDIIGRKIREYLPSGDGAERILSLMNFSRDMLADHAVNRRRLDTGNRPANSIWLWGQGKRPAMPRFREKYGKSGAIVSAVDLTRGIGFFAGFEIILVPGATGYLDTNYAGKVEASLEALERLDLVYLHVEAPDEAGHSGNYRDKIRAIEDFDSRIVGPVMKGIAKFDRYRILLLPDHPTPISIRTHSPEPVPYVLYSSGERGQAGRKFDEGITDDKEGFTFEEGHLLMDALLEVEGGTGV